MNYFFFIKIDIVIILITSIKQIILINNFNFDKKKSLIRFKKFNKNDQIATFLKKSKPN